MNSYYIEEVTVYKVVEITDDHKCYLIDDFESLLAAEKCKRELEENERSSENAKDT